MQIFVTDYDPKIAAQNLCDIHLNKQILESAQMLSTYIWSTHRPSLIYSPAKKEEYKKETGLCVPCYINHPCNVWLRKDIKNVHWLHNHFIELIMEYQYRKDKIHDCIKYTPVFAKHLMNLYSFPMPRPENFVAVMADEFKTDDVVESYRTYYNSKQTTMKVPMKWSKREKPVWFKEIELLDISFYKGE